MDFFNLSGCELVSLAAILAITIAKDFTADETDTLGNFFSALGSNLSTIASAQGADSSSSDSKEKQNSTNVTDFTDCNT